MSNWKADHPYNELPLLPPHGDLETRAVLKQCVTARAALAALSQAISHIPNPAILINTLPKLEAGASSAIENIVTTSDKLFRFAEAESQADPATREALRYGAALLAGSRAITDHPLNTRTAEAVCSQIKNTDMKVRRVPGTQVVNDRTGEVIYTPPVGEALLRDLLANWERFVHDQTEVDPLVRLAVAHYQFEAIHPFTDGNGRTGRVLNSLLLVHEKLLPLPLLYLSRYIISNREEYYRLLLEVTQREAWEEWILYMLRGIDETAQWTTAKINAIRALMEATRTHIRTSRPKIYSSELIDVLFERPYCRIGDIVSAGIGERVTASRYLKQLAEIEVLREEKFGREKLFLHPRYLTLLAGDQNDFPPYRL